MNTKTFIWVGMMVGGGIGGYLPVLFGFSSFSFASVILSTVGGLIGIWLGFKISKMF